MPSATPAGVHLARRTLTTAIVLTLALAATGPALAATLAEAVAPADSVAVDPPSAAVTSDDGAFVSGVTQLDSRMLDLRISSPAVGAIVPVRVLLPRDWAPDANRSWPVLYLLQGAHDDYTAWTRETDIESFTADKELIVAMPSAGPTGIPTRWLNGGTDKPDYETFEVTELMQLLQRSYHAGTARAVGGVSTGGYGALAMAAHFPGAFTAAASYSGVLDTTALGVPAVIDAIVARENVSPSALWGDPIANAGLWNADNPYDLIAYLRWTAIFLSCGSGLGSGGDGNAVGASLESALWPQAKSFAQRLKLLGIQAQTDFYVGGVHDWPDWRREFTKSWPLLAASLGLS
jgi:S-formylglutathione hydrolase FrmB